MLKLESLPYLGTIPSTRNSKPNSHFLCPYSVYFIVRNSQYNKTYKVDDQY